jgi:NTE family protein
MKLLPAARLPTVMVSTLPRAEQWMTAMDDNRGVLSTGPGSEESVFDDDNRDRAAEGLPGPAPWRPDRCSRIALIFQGGGALGAYQAGVYEALHEAGIEPDWMTGVSIGAINAAIIAGNPREVRLQRLRAFWDRITERRIWSYTPDGDIFRRARNSASALTTMTQGQPGFFKPHPLNAWLSPAGAATATSFYDTAPLRQTLNELVDFDRINRQKCRFSVGAVNVLNGNFIYFDNARQTITAEHIMASGALPPAFPMIKIGTEYYWDGGIVSNTPLQHLLDQEDGKDSLVFQVDLFSARGTLPRDMEDVLGRHKDIMYSSRTRLTTDVYRRLLTWKAHVRNALDKVPDELLDDEERQLKRELANMPSINIVHMIYQQKAYEGHAKDHEFSHTSMREHWASGYDDTSRTLGQRHWLEMPPPGVGVTVHDVHRMSDV